VRTRPTVGPACTMRCSHRRCSSDAAAVCGGHTSGLRLFQFPSRQQSAPKAASRAQVAWTAGARVSTLGCPKRASYRNALVSRNAPAPLIHSSSWWTSHQWVGRSSRRTRQARRAARPPSTDAAGRPAWSGRRPAAARRGPARFRVICASQASQRARAAEIDPPNPVTATAPSGAAAVGEVVHVDGHDRVRLDRPQERQTKDPAAPHRSQARAGPPAAGSPVRPPPGA
jgi:hypothetical protein